MKIRSMTATFGKLSAARLELSDGLNIITAPNEGGKSTWAAFLKAMLYGIDTRDRDRRGYLADKNRYQPWSGAPMEGEMQLTWQGREITLRRFQKGHTPFGGFSAVYTATGEAVPGMTAANCGQFLLGVEREVYERSAFIGQGGTLAITAAPELEKRIAALTTSGEEDVSFAQTQARLKEWRNRRRVNRSVGCIPELEQQLSDTGAALSALRGVIQEAARLDGERVALQREHTALIAEQEIHRRLAQRSLNQRFAQAQADWEADQARLTALELETAKYGPIPPQERLKEAQGDLQYLKALSGEIKLGETALADAEAACTRAEDALADDHFSGMTGEEAVLQARDDSVRCQAALSQAHQTRKQVPLLLGAGVLLLAALVALDLAGQGGLGLLSGLGLACAGGMAVLALLTRNRAKAQAVSAAQILSRYGVDTPQAAEDLAREYRARYQTAEEAVQTRTAVRDGLNNHKLRHDTCRAALLDFVHSFAPEVRDLFGCSAALSRALNLDHELALARERVQASRRRADDLAAQGGQPFDTLDFLLPPQRTPAETDAALAASAARLKQVTQALNQTLGQQQAMGDPAALAARKEALERELSRRQAEYDAIDLAMKVLEQADSRLRERFSPALNQRAGELMARLTGGRYTNVALNRELEGAAVQTGAILPRSSLCLSRGTVDQLYLAVRLAVYQLCLPGPERAPILLDDALAAFDDERLALALELLTELGRKEQILLFTCQSREKTYLADREGVTLVTMEHGCNPG
ncbi:MAG: AAA family ATPase [Clostridium sp.]|nr:AAA family ATPase [Clostridium sp.]